MLIHHKIKEIRESKNISQEKIAAKLGISQNTYHLIETGKSKLKFDHVLLIADFLEVGINELLPDSDSIQNIHNNVFEDGGNQIINNVVHSFNLERKETF